MRELAELALRGQEVTENDLAAAQGRFCEPEEVAAAALFLASPAAGFVNGAALVIDNGWTAIT
jgi:NAD(P)-dependent dehydrogenase (short-subunit alcohol dehydrogenase family)